MLDTTDKLIRQHMAYLLSLENITAELSKFESLFDHILYFSTSILKMDVREAVLAIDDFMSDGTFENAGYNSDLNEQDHLT